MSLALLMALLHRYPEPIFAAERVPYPAQMTKDNPAFELFVVPGGGVGWLALKSVCVSGRTVPLPDELRTGHPRAVERGYVYTQFPGYTNPGILVWSAGGAVRSYSGLQVSYRSASIDLDGEPVGVVSAGDSSPGSPYRGRRPLPLPLGALPTTPREGRVLAARRERLYAGSVRIGKPGSPRLRAVLWRDPDASPEVLPIPKPYTDASVWAVNNQGDVAGVLTRSEGDPSGVLWRGGKAELIPLTAGSKGTAKDRKHRLVWTTPLALTDDGLVVLIEGESPGGGHHPMLWDGKRINGLANFVRGRSITIAPGATVAENGRDLYVRAQEIESFQNDVWYRLKRLP